jgi:hypothetical protein
VIGLGLRPLAHPSAGTPQLAYAGAQLAQQEGSERIATREPDRVIEVQWSHGSNPPSSPGTCRSIAGNRGTKPGAVRVIRSSMRRITPTAPARALKIRVAPARVSSRS